jgi:hypothetical protein
MRPESCDASMKETELEGMYEWKREGITRSYLWMRENFLERTHSFLLRRSLSKIKSFLVVSNCKIVAESKILISLFDHMQCINVSWKIKMPAGAWSSMNHLGRAHNHLMYSASDVNLFLGQNFHHRKIYTTGLSGPRTCKESIQTSIRSRTPTRLDFLSPNFCELQLFVVIAMTSSTTQILGWDFCGKIVGSFVNHWEFCKINQWRHADGANATLQSLGKSNFMLEL